MIKFSFILYCERVLKKVDAQVTGYADNRPYIKRPSSTWPFAHTRVNIRSFLAHIESESNHKSNSKSTLKRNIYIVYVISTSYINNMMLIKA